FFDRLRIIKKIVTFAKFVTLILPLKQADFFLFSCSYEQLFLFLLIHVYLIVRVWSNAPKGRIRVSKFFLLFTQIGTNLQILLEDRSLKK
ncbi:hypothetical protein, partial [Enterococcus faecalis]|uniref:hypothetical protein n=1 Tax=Enterococcus faecalis TaxID=1351 RepID=UPI0039A59020